MMAKHYGYKIDDLKELTFEQVNTYLINLNFVLEMSGDLGQAPEAQPPNHELIDFARRCGIVVPYDVHYDMIMSKKEIED